MKKRHLILKVFILFVLVLATAVSVSKFRVKVNQFDSGNSQLKAAKVNTSSKASHSFIEDNCYKCHDEDVQKGDFRLDDLSWDFNSKTSFETWKKIYTAISEGQMPPKKKPTAASIDEFLNTLHHELVNVEKKLRQISGRSVIRRLTRKEYENTIKDIFGLPYIDMARFLPEDGNHHGFAKNHDSLDFSAVHLKNYIDAAGALLENSTRPGSKPSPKTFAGKINNKANMEHYYPGVDKSKEGFWIFTNGFSTHHVRPAALSQKIQHSGYYEIEFNAKAVQTKKPYLLKLYSDANSVLQSEWAHLKIYDVEPVEWQTFKERIWFEKDSTICFTTPEAKHRRSGARILTQPGIALKEIKVKGPFYDEWPLKRHTVLWGDLKFVEETAGKRKKSIYRVQKPKDFLAKAQELINNFVNTVYRSPASNEEKSLFFNIFKDRYRASNNFKQSLMAAYKAILCSPAFLYKQERGLTLTQYELATRLSYFLWNSKPDRALLEMAGQNKLQGILLAEQVNRLLADEKSQRFIDDFNDQWLNLADLFVTDPDPRLYPEASPALFRLMKKETNLFVKELIDKDYSVLNIIDSNFAMLNGKLARYYGLDGITGSEIKAYKLPEGHERGGIISQGSVLKVTANGTVTSPITRGVWFLERIMGTPPPLPPNAVPAFEPEDSGLKTLREGLAEHRTNAACNGCHKRIDPPGFAFECFDPIGGYRKNYRTYFKNKYKLGRKIENSDVLTGGEKFNSIQEFKKLIVRDKRLIAKNILNKLSIYSTGQDLSFSDKEEVEKILNKASSNNYGLRTIIHSLVQSKIFCRK